MLPYTFAWCIIRKTLNENGYNEKTIVIPANCRIIYNLRIKMHRKRKRRHFGSVNSQWHSTVFNANFCRIQRNYIHFASVAVTKKCAILLNELEHTEIFSYKRNMFPLPTVLWTRNLYPCTSPARHVKGNSDT